jgi:tetratricopeptide (TPR) repeat protein
MEKVAVDNKKSKVPRLRWLAIGVAIIVLAASIGAGTRWLQTHNQHKKQQGTATSTPVTPAQTVASKSASESEKKALDGNYDAAQQQIITALKQPNLSNDDKYTLYYQQGANYENYGNNQAALDSYKQAAQNKQTQEIYESMAEVAVKLGDKSAAITYYKKEIQLIPTNNPVAKSDKASIEKSITDLGGQP